MDNEERKNQIVALLNDSREDLCRLSLAAYQAVYYPDMEFLIQAISRVRNVLSICEDIYDEKTDLSNVNNSS